MDLSELKQLKNLISSIIDSSEWLLELTEKIFEVGFPDTEEKYRFCNDYFFYDHSWDQYFGDICKIHLSADDSDRFRSILDNAHDVVLHGISISTKIGDLQWFLREPHDSKYRKFTEVLFPLTQDCYPLEYSLDSLKEQYKQKTELWDQLPDDNDDEDEDLDQMSILPDPLFEQDGYIRILQSITMIRNCCKNLSSKQTEFFLFLTEQLNKFAEGEEFEEFSFSLVLEENEEKQYLDFHGDGICVSVTDAGYSYDPYVGGDSYTNWEYTIWGNGLDEGSLELNEDKILEMIQMGATISIDEPEDFLEETQED